MNAYHQYLRYHDVFDFEGWFHTLQTTFDEITARIYAHNVLGHGFHLTEDLVRIPLIIVDKDRFPGGAAVPELRSQIDLSATILDLAGIWEKSRDLFSVKSIFEKYEKDWIYIEANGSGGKQYTNRCYLRGAKNTRWKYWQVEAESIEHQVLWDLANDPRETTNVAGAYPEVCEAAADFIFQSLKNWASSQIDLTSSEADVIEERLVALGYL